MNSSTPNNTSNTSTSPNASFFNLEGRILRKKNISAEHLKLAIQQQNHEKSTTIYIPRKDDFASANLLPSEVNFLYLDSIIRVQGFVNENGFHHVTSCHLVKCAPNTKLLKDLLALPNYLSFASTLGFVDEEEMMQNLIDKGGKKSKKAVVNCIIEKLTGKRAKEPPRYRKARLKRFDLSILESKEAEGRRLANDSGSTSHDNGNSNGAQIETDPMKLNWTLCQPCSIQPLLNNKIDLTNVTPTSHNDHRKESNIINLPTGSSNSTSAHGKLTRSEYLETKKNHQALWFVQRIRKFQELPTRFLDVGGGRGDLAVTLARHFPTMEGVVVDNNASSVEAGREYARMCGVGDRIEFVCMDFTSYIRQYDNDNNNNNDGNGDDVHDDNDTDDASNENSKNLKDQRCRKPVDFVVALHACGDLSDMALSFASTHSCDFIVCPCCYVKRYLAPFKPHWHTFCTHQEVDSLSRLVELDDHREVSRRAMLVVNSMRRNAFEEREDGEEVDGRKGEEKKGKRKRKVVLEEFDNRISRRNIALVGTAVLS